MATASNCKDWVERITDYLEGSLSSDARVHFEAHLQACKPCQNYLEQMRQTIRCVGALREVEAVPAETKAKLLQLFHASHPAAAVDKGRRIRLGILDQYAAPGDHIGYFWETEQEFQEGVGFLAAGLHNGDACFIFGHEAANDKVLALLRERGFAVEELRRNKLLQVLTGNPSGDAMLGEIGAAFQAALAAGAPTLRLLGNIGWGKRNWPADDEILAFEAKVTEAAKQLPCVIVCMYDVRSLSGRVLLKGGFETHPLTVRNDVVQENPHYVPTEQYLSALRGRAGWERIQ
ncbi:MAG TPA: MEDS domain-containing protein [Candidatus Acidoferrales bacterium]|nr:MEDS domain-containing protein [Candidatus Acidoferrales bacterium]